MVSIRGRNTVWVRVRVRVRVRVVVPALLCLLHDTVALLPQVLYKLGERGPTRGIHMNVLLVRNVLGVDAIGQYLLGAVEPVQLIEEAVLKVSTEFGDHLVRILRK